VITSRTTSRSGSVAQMGKKRNPYCLLMGKPEGNGMLGFL
jgi:hypothetical protein